MLKIKKLDPAAKLPTVAHPDEDIAYDLYALEDTVLKFGVVTKVRTGIAAQASAPQFDPDSFLGYNKEKPLGLLIRDRSSMAAKGIVVSGGVLDSGYTGEISVLLSILAEGDGVLMFADGDNDWKFGYKIKAGDKIAQMIPYPYSQEKLWK